MVLAHLTPKRSIDSEFCEEVEVVEVAAFLHDLKSKVGHVFVAVGLPF
jgi:hypothetical protein